MYRLCVGVLLPYLGGGPMCAASNEREVLRLSLPPVSPWEKLARATVRSDRQW